LATKRKSSKTTSKKDLEAKIAQLESKLQQLSAQVAPKPAGQAQTAPPPPPKQAEAPKPASQQQAQAPVTRETLIERTSVGIWHDRKTKTPGYVPENPRAWARRHAEGADAPTTPWGLQKTKVPGYTAPSNKYFATRQRLASLPGGRLSYHPEVTGFTGYGISLGHGASQAQAQVAPPPPPAQDRAVPKETSSSGGGSSKKSSLEDYERDYLARLDAQDREAEELHQAASELAAKKRAESGSSSSSGSSTRGSLPKGF
jgi:hypothetical protein